ncbi:TadE/TadG family type IV pilus assembly protein [Frigidibacter sp. MR17.24]|uniref:TadE/TadG family type IV pilus assembly protein n=1 Tax=Frigidibacter sp. MR17.24 TaxID=3127345 RepID=UPI003012FB63
MRPSLALRLLRPLVRFRRSERGSMTAEAVIILPAWIFVYIMTFTFFDAFRTHTVNLRATYTVADMVSRQTNAVGPTYLTSLKNVFDYVARSPQATTMTVSSIYYDTTTQKYRVNWSYTKGGTTQTDTTIQAQKARIPNLKSGETLILVETHMGYDPVFNIGINDIDYDYFITTAPRFAAQVAYSASS